MHVDYKACAISDTPQLGIIVFHSVSRRMKIIKINTIDTNHLNGIN